MNLSSKKGWCYEFDGKLSFSSGTSAVIECSVMPSFVGGRKAEIDLRVPSTSMPLRKVENPCSVESLDTLSETRIQLENVWFRKITCELPSQRITGSVPITLSYVGKLKIIRQKNYALEGCSEVAKSTIRFLLNDNVYLGRTSLMTSIHDKLGEFEDHLCQIEIPDLGMVRFVRDWAMVSAIDENDVNVQSGFAAVFDITDNVSLNVEEIVSKFEDALFVISVLWRQRVFVVGWHLYTPEKDEHVWNDPLNPLITKFIPEHETEFLVDPSRFETMASSAIKAYFELSPELKTVFKDFSVGIAPFLDLSTSQQFMSLFHTLEGCTRFSKGLNLTPEELTSNESLRQALERAKEGADSNTCNRLDGLIKNIHKPSVQQRLKLVLSSWSVYQHSLWPLFGTESLSGLKNIRDRLAHSGSSGVDHQSLDVANRHFCILVERILISFLKLPLEQTNANGNGYSRFRRDSDDEILKLRNQALNVEKSE